MAWVGDEKKQNKNKKKKTTQFIPAEDCSLCMNHFEALQGGTETHDSKVSSTNNHWVAILSCQMFSEKKH